jgi:RimJ/RimL family protein N-acetyltransferase
MRHRAGLRDEPAAVRYDSAVTSVMPAPAQPIVEGYGLVLRGWDDDLVPQLANWGHRGFPYHAFDLGHLNDPFRRASALSRYRDLSQHRHYIACEDGIPVGRVSVNLNDPTGLYLWSVHVPPEHEGRGICRRMLAALIESLEAHFPGRDFALTTNTFATRAHRAYQSVGFVTQETRWHYDREIAEQLWRVPHDVRAPIATHIRFHNGRWEVRVYTMKRRSGSPLPPL